MLNNFPKLTDKETKMAKPIQDSFDRLARDLLECPPDDPTYEIFEMVYYHGCMTVIREFTVLARSKPSKEIADEVIASIKDECSTFMKNKLVTILRDWKEELENDEAGNAV